MTAPGATATPDGGAGEGSAPAPRETRILGGAPIAAGLRDQVAAGVEAFRDREGFAPALAVLLLGPDAPSAVYLDQILRTSARVGIDGRRVEVAGTPSDASVRRALRELNADPRVAGVIVQQPLPPQVPLDAVIDVLDPTKDVDGICPQNAGLVALGHPGFVPATAQAAVEILTRSGYDLDGMHAVVVGRSNVVGKPVSLLLLRQHCTVTICHTHTRDLAAMTRQADIVVVAAGVAGLVTGAMIRPGALVVDVGINVVGARIVGDVDAASVDGIAAARTPVPGGVGPVTNAILMQHVLEAARRQADARR